MLDNNNKVINFKDQYSHAQSENNQSSLTCPLHKRKEGLHVKIPQDAFFKNTS